MSSMWIKKLKGLKGQKKRKTIEDLLGPEEVKRIEGNTETLSPEVLGVEVQSNLIAHIFAMNAVMQGAVDFEETAKLTSKIIDMFEDKDYATIFVTLDFLNYYFNGLLRERIKTRDQEEVFQKAVCEFAKLSRLDKILGLDSVSKDEEKELNQMFG